MKKGLEFKKDSEWNRVFSDFDRIFGDFNKVFNQAEKEGRVKTTIIEKGVKKVVEK